MSNCEVWMYSYDQVIKMLDIVEATKSDLRMYPKLPDRAKAEALGNLHHAMRVLENNLRYNGRRLDILVGSIESQAREMCKV